MAILANQGPASLLHNGALRIASCWQITRKDGTQFHFTNHNKSLQVGLGGPTFVPTDGLSSTAVQKQTTFKAGNFEAKGVISDSAITDADLRAGKFRDAEVKELLVNWDFPWAGPIMSTRYYIESVSWNESTWEAQLTGIASRFKRRLGDTYTRGCRYDLGDSLCTLNIDTFKSAIQTVNTVTNSVLEFTCTVDPVGVTGYYDYGRLLWVTGVNSGIEVDIGRYDDVAYTVTLSLPMLNKISSGDTFYMWAGCNKEISSCSAKFDNVINFGGFPFIPGNDRMAEGPNLTGGSGNASS